MKHFLFLSLVATLLLSNSECNYKKLTTSNFRGRLEIKGICYNYTIKLIEGQIDSALVSTKWIDENTGKSYANVFALSDPCSFPDAINEGDSFDFIIDSSAIVPCIVCDAYYPTPPRSLKIKVVER